jgi:hypothetical protein
MGPWKVNDTVPAAVEHTMWTQAHGGDLSRNCVAGSVTTFSDAAAALQSDVNSKTARQMERASPLIASALGDDAPLRTVADADGDPTKILCLLDARFASSRVISRISSQTALYRKTYNNGDMFVFVDELASLLPSWCARDPILLFRSRTRLRFCLRRSPSSRRWRQLQPRREQRICRS